MSEEKKEELKPVEEIQPMKKIQSLSVESRQELTKFNNFINVEEQLKYAKYLIDSKLINFAKPEHAVMAMNVGRALGVDAAVAATYMYPIDGKITLSVHLATALARRAGVDWEVVKDGVKEEIGTDPTTNKPLYDIVTEIKFYRYNEKLDKVMVNTMTYTWKDAINAQLNTKDNWKKRPRNMLRARCLMEGIRFVASDSIMGLFYESSEMADSSNQTYELDDEGNIIIQ